DLRRPALRCVRSAAEFPKRPDLTILSETIPLFYIVRNSHGFWVARDAEGSCGGIFLLRSSALRFARNKMAPAGCATMDLSGPLELDIPNQGSRLVEPLSKGIDIARQRAPALAGSVTMAIGGWRRFATQVSRAFAEERRHRAAIERELFRGEYTLTSKNDDDLPVL
ncbi:MAG: hypothetical protein WBB34_08305, partial [Xanthobacteraceae bacterium]